MVAGTDWTGSENEAVVAAYLQMLEDELRGVPYVKARVNQLVQRATGRSRGSVEYKFQNVSAVLRELNHPFVNGYKPAINFQDSLRDAVVAAVRHASALEAAALAALSRPAPPGIAEYRWSLVDAPTFEFSASHGHLRRAAKRDYVALDAANRSLGLAGERAVVSLERHRLESAGLTRLAGQVEHVSQTRGDGLGFDVLSFTPDGTEKLIEVKTTRQGVQWPMLISRNEVELSHDEAPRFHLYRLFNFGAPIIGRYELAGDIASTCLIRPAVYEALPSGLPQQRV